LRSLPSGRRVISYDARGYGQSAPPTGPFSQFDDAVAVLDRLGVPSALLVGHSGGGGTAVSLALTHPERVTGLVLVAPGVSDYPWPATDAYFTGFEAAFAAGDRAALVELGRRTWSPGDASEDTTSMLRGAVDASVAAAIATHA
jgi:pimeloyl-ACP methyl ester carboxylesterase